MSDRSTVVEPPEPADARLLELLRTALREQVPAPGPVIAAGRAAYAWHDTDIELALLSFDSTVDELAGPVGVRAPLVPPRALTFVGPSLTIEVECADGILIGQVLPPGPGTVTVVPAVGEPVSVDLDDVGGFALQPAPTGSFRLEVRAGERTTRTDWFRV
jgi:hypothetical protein